MAKDKELFTDVSKSDAKKLVDWWNGNTEHYHFKKKDVSSKKYYVIRQNS